MVGYKKPVKTAKEVEAHTIGSLMEELRNVTNDDHWSHKPEGLPTHPDEFSKAVAFKKLQKFIRWMKVQGIRRYKVEDFEVEFDPAVFSMGVPQETRGGDQQKKKEEKEELEKLKQVIEAQPTEEMSEEDLLWCHTYDEEEGDY